MANWVARGLLLAALLGGPDRGRASAPDLFGFGQRVSGMGATGVAHAEGWAIYASYLAEDMGLYDDPYSRYGALAGRMLYAARLVVDTGLNHFGWSGEQAAETLRSYTLTSETQANAEVLRYGVETIGQVLGYGVGAAKFLEWRHRAEEALGEDFDVRHLRSVE